MSFYALIIALLSETKKKIDFLFFAIYYTSCAKCLHFLQLYGNVYWVIEMDFYFNREKLTQVTTDFAYTVGVNMNILDKDFNWLCLQFPKINPYCSYIQSTIGTSFCDSWDRRILEKCRDTKQPQIHTCPAGLVDIAVPLIHEDLILGYLILGQIRNKSTSPKLAQSLLNEGLDVNIMHYNYKKLPLLNQRQIDGIVNIATILAHFIISESLLFPVSIEMLTLARNYIDANLSSNPGIQEISKAIGCSTSALYKSFHKYFNCTVGEYLNKRKIEKSIYYLLQTDLSIEQISQQTGFSSTAYFSKKFKEEKGISPLKFRKQTIHI